MNTKKSAKNPQTSVKEKTSITENKTVEMKELAEKTAEVAKVKKTSTVDVKLSEVLNYYINASATKDWRVLAVDPIRDTVVFIRDVPE